MSGSRSSGDDDNSEPGSRSSPSSSGLHSISQSIPTPVTEQAALTPNVAWLSSPETASSSAKQSPGGRNPTSRDELHSERARRARAADGTSIGGDTDGMPPTHGTVAPASVRWRSLRATGSTLCKARREFRWSLKRRAPGGDTPPGLLSCSPRLHEEYTVSSGSPALWCWLSPSWRGTISGYSCFSTIALPPVHPPADGGNVLLGRSQLQPVPGSSPKRGTISRYACFSIVVLSPIHPPIKAGNANQYVTVHDQCPRVKRCARLL